MLTLDRVSISPMKFSLIEGISSQQIKLLNQVTEDLTLQKIQSDTEINYMSVNVLFQ